MTTIREAGEAGTIDVIRAASPSKINGDDAAVLALATPNSRTVVATDMLVENRHFRLDWSTPEEIGAKAAIQNIADIEAMGARPIALLLGLSAPGHMDLTVVEGIANGINDVVHRCNAELVGGDVVGGEQLVLSITALGELGGPAHPLNLDRAQRGDIVVAAGQIGYSAAGLALLTHFGDRSAIPDDPRLQKLVRAHTVPDFAFGRGNVARAAGAHAMTDNSDGLIQDLGVIADASLVSINVTASAIAPDENLLAAGEVLGMDPWEWVLGGGEDHTILATTKLAAPSGFREIGRVVSARDSAAHVTLDGNIPPVTTGWSSF